MTPESFVEALRPMPLFELFSDEQLAWVAERAEYVEQPAGTVLVKQGEPPEHFWMMLEGEIEITRQAFDRELTLVTSNRLGAWAGMVPYVYEATQHTARTLRDSRLFRIPADAVREMVDRGFPIGKHLMLGVTSGSQRWQEHVAERERMLSLGKLSAGLAHELNNPAGAARRAASQLRVALAEHERATLEVACAAPASDLAARLAALREEVAKLAEAAPVLGPLDRSDAEEALGAWLVEAGVDDGDDVAPTLVESGLGVDDVARLVPASEGSARVPLLRWLAASTASLMLVHDVEEATTRIADLVKSIKAYSYVDRAGLAEVDVRRGLDDTLKVLRGHLEGITVVRDYAEDLPSVVGRGGELNQVWTNLIDNAADALDGSGTLTVGAHRDGDRVVVTVVDDGPGIPPEVVRRVFEPFFTTKGVGKGTGLGLDISRRIVADAGGELSVESAPGRTVFTVTLPRERGMGAE